jgi:hypothetical protein
MDRHVLFITATSRTFRLLTGEDEMLCVLCQHDEAFAGKTLCVPCLEMIGRLQVITKGIDSQPIPRLKAAAANEEYGKGFWR